MIIRGMISMARIVLIHNQGNMFTLIMQVNWLVHNNVKQSSSLRFEAHKATTRGELAISDANYDPILSGFELDRHSASRMVQVFPEIVPRDVDS